MCAAYTIIDMYINSAWMHLFMFCMTPQVISCPKDYKLWCESMYGLFGTKWTKIHGGPMWSVEAVTQGGSQSLSSSRNTLDVS